MCMPDTTCYVIIPKQPPSNAQTAASAATPWYERLWQSVRQADKVPAK